MHQVCVLDAAGTVRGERVFEHGAVGLSEMAAWLLSFAAGAADEVAVAIETPRGPVVESLMERDCTVHAINQKPLDRFRDRISPAGAKDDRRDARVLASALPYRLALSAAAQRVREATLTRLLTQHRIRRVDAAILRERLRTPAVKVASGTAEAAIAHGRLVTERRALVNRQLDHACRHLDRLVRQLTEAAPADALTASAEAEPASSNTPADATILLSLPGIGTDVLATLLAERRGARRRRNYHALRCRCGVAPVTRRAGKSPLVVRRLAAHDRLRDAAYH